MSASAGPNASPVAEPTREECFSTVAAPPPLAQRWPEYPGAQPMRTDAPPTSPTHSYPSSNSNSAITLELAVQYDHPTVTSDSNHAQDRGKGLCTICRSTTQDDLVFYRPQMQVHKVLSMNQIAAAAGEQGGGGGGGASNDSIPRAYLPYVTLYGPQKQALWSLTGKQWNALEFTSPKDQHVVKLLKEKLAFVWINNVSYQWRFMPATDPNTNTTTYDLRCYEGRQVIAEFISNRYIQWSHAAQQPQQQAANPFRQNESLFSSFLLLSGLLILDLAGCPPRSTPDPEALLLWMAPDSIEQDDEDDTASMASSLYYAEQGLVDNDHAPTGRWYGGGVESVKSIELDPGLLHCWWGYGFWWTWCPCCMPGGWFDRFRWSLRRRKEINNHSNSNTSRSRQRRQRGWQQHHPDQY
ncbi:hypothetical protein O0I10_004852 [Lichtheimia ornata]|uniref:Uncharacterized protein n=1 Tax=Lichtheimia ornata TaxID=688661 RepID=A0AAD7V5P6_9FUNG|nr:uncharacterized protein O0I10_004852 [Lichtheimia ornata]KAJ8659487.1 hypothetical protein O0I10_004852 [Lichtheimia ornata]